MFYFCQLSVIEGKSDEPSEERDVTSHFKPICGAIYNDLFNQVRIMLNFTPKGPPQKRERNEQLFALGR